MVIWLRANFGVAGLKYKLFLLTSLRMPFCILEVDRHTIGYQNCVLDVR